MEFSRELREDVMSGEITVSFRLWRRPKVRQGGQYPVGPVKIEVAAEARVVTVHWDPGHRKPIPFSAAERTQLAAAMTR